jgi:hypothetical protein
MRGFLLVTFAASAIALATPALAQTYTPAQQRRACFGDAIRLCVRYIPNRSRVFHCMQARHDELSPKCRRVFDAGVQTRS